MQVHMYVYSSMSSISTLSCMSSMSSVSSVSSTVCLQAQGKLCCPTCHINFLLGDFIALYLSSLREYCIRLYIYTLHSTVHNKDHNIHNNTLQHFLLELILPAELILPLELILFHYEIQTGLGIRSFPFFIKECGVLCVLFRSL